MNQFAEISGRVLGLVVQAIEEMNRDLGYETLRNVNEETVIWGTPDGVDSLTLVGFAVDLERRVKLEFSMDVSLTDEEAFSPERTPFRSVRALTGHIARAVDSRS